MNGPFVIGMDGGGTATTVIVAGLHGDLMKNFRLGPLNINGQSREAAEHTLADLKIELEKSGMNMSDCIGICIGAAGISNRDTAALLTRKLKEQGMQGVIKLVGDHETALAGALEEPAGVILIAGTGSICYGINESGDKFRAGGYGHIIDDAGSAYAIGRDILKAVVRSSDGRQGQTVLKEKTFRSLKVDSVEDLITWLYQPGRSKKEIAALAPLLEEGIREKDQASIGISDRCGEELAELAGAVLTHFQSPVSLVVSGSVLMKNNEIYRLFCEKVKKRFPQLEIMKMRGEAAQGAVRIILRETAERNGYETIPGN
ncbi:BadF/BadG/BcrA/BcrD ATPase family protein [Lacrimispora sp.]|uniref:BadF/BadG/BcrA/BcrD ATPase family protein n=1 Tax=Lacrimispora sp. TaxID=2719234 RepID=UPI0028A2C936|nr:BadF/BadG/BcrA/BcrD ATPase family protein [Lacrimispora sp.]